MTALVWISVYSARGGPSSSLPKGLCGRLLRTRQRVRLRLHLLLCRHHLGCHHRRQSEAHVEFVASAKMVLTQRVEVIV